MANAAHGVRIAVPLVDLLDQARQHATHPLRTVGAPRAAFGDLEHALLGLVHQLARRLALLAEHRGGNGVPGADQRAQQRFLAHDLRVGARIGGGGRIAHQRAQIGQAPDVVQLAALASRSETVTTSMGLDSATRSAMASKISR